MAENKKKDIDRFWSEYEEISSKEKWDVNDLEKMKNLLKCIYYKEVICAMDEASEDGYEYRGMPSRSYARGNPRHNPNTGRFMSGSYPMNDNYYDDGMSGRRYYDDGGAKQMALHRFESIAEAERDPELREAMKELMHMVQSR